MIVALLFWALLLACLGFATLYGGRDGRRLAGVYLANVILTIPATLLGPEWHHPQLLVFLVDALLLVALFWIVMTTDRWFPVWFTGFHLVAVLSHLASLFVPGYAYKVYFLLQSFWSLPMLLSLVIGIALDRNAGVCDELDPRPRAHGGSR